MTISPDTRGKKKGLLHWRDHIKPPSPVISAVDGGYLTSCLKLFSRISVNYREATACTDGQPWLTDQKTRGRINTCAPKLIGRRFTIVWGGCRACDWVENRKRAKSLLAPGMYSRCAHYVYMFGDLATDVTRCRRSIPTDRLKIIGEMSEWLRINAPSRKYRDKEIKK